MLLIIGLGNPGKEYEHTRHNAGREAVTFWAGMNGYPVFKSAKKFQALVSESAIAGKKAICALPETYMNESGRAVKTLVMFYKIGLANVVIVHDDIDLPLGTVRLVKDRGAGGHHGVESAQRELGTQDLVRLRIGIAPPGGPKPDTEKFVLERWTTEEEKTLSDVMQRAAASLSLLLEEGFEKTASATNANC